MGNALHRFWFLLAPYRVSLILGIAMLLGTKLAEAAVVPLLRDAIDSLPHEPPMEYVALVYLWPIFLYAIVMLITRILSRVYLFGMGRRVEHDTRNQVYRNLLRLPPSYFQVTPVGELMSRLSNDVTALRYMTGGGTLLGLNTVFTYALYLPMMAAMSLKLTAVYFVLLPVSIFFMAQLAGQVKVHFKTVQEKIGDISTLVQENLSGIHVIQGYAKEVVESTRLNRVGQKYLEAYRALIQNRVWLFLLMTLGGGLGLLAILLEGGREILTQELTLGELVAFIVILERINWPTMAMGWVLSMFQQGFAALDRVDEVLRAQPAVPSPLFERRGVANPSIQHLIDTGTAPEIRFNQFSFRYTNPYGELPQDSDTPETHSPSSEASNHPHRVLKSISLTIQPGEMVGFVGPVGSGKSTLLASLLRFSPLPDESIFLNDRDINQIHTSPLRQLMAWMPQHSTVFSDSVLNNLIFGQPDALESSKTEPSGASHEITSPPPPTSLVGQTTSLVQLSGDIERLPQGYDTLIGERGLMLSGGQRQRLTLGRAVLVKTPILLLDDPFSNMDADTERTIIEALMERQTLAGKTTLVASHRMSLIQRCNRIVLMDEGRIVAIGTHVELMATEPLYQSLNQQDEKRTLPPPPGLVTDPWATISTKATTTVQEEPR